MLPYSLGWLGLSSHEVAREGVVGFQASCEGVLARMGVPARIGVADPSPSPRMGVREEAQEGVAGTPS